MRRGQVPGQQEGHSGHPGLGLQLSARHYLRYEQKAAHPDPRLRFFACHDPHGCRPGRKGQPHQVEGRELLGYCQRTQRLSHHDQRVVQRVHVPRGCQQEVHAQEVHETYGAEAHPSSRMGSHVHGGAVT